MHFVMNSPWHFLTLTQLPEHKMRLGSGMEAWPSSRLGDRFATGNHIGTVRHIRPTIPKPQPIKENSHHEQTVNTLRTSSTQPSTAHEAHGRYLGSDSSHTTHQVAQPKSRQDDKRRTARMGDNDITSHQSSDTTLWFRRVK